MTKEVIVVGAGPAGATAATCLAQQGHDVLLLDRQTFPRDKACGDGIPAGSTEIMHRLGMKEKIQQALASNNFYPLTALHLVSPGGHLLQASFHCTPETTKSYVARRFYFDALLQQHAVESGATFCQADVRGPIVENGRVTGVQARVNGHLQEFRARVVIAADGVTSRLGRFLRPKTGKQQDIHRAVALRAYIEDIEEVPHTVEFYLYKDILPGYAWIFPTGKNSANIGLGMRLDKFRRQSLSLEEMLQRFLQIPPVKERLKHGETHDATTWQLAFGSQKRLQRAFDGALLIGDAGAFINPLTGGGIHNAMISAELAAQTVHQALQNSDTSRQALLLYEQRCARLLAPGMRQSFLLTIWLMRFPVLVDFLVKRIKENNVFMRTFASKL